jgi:hypothetical protein
VTSFSIPSVAIPAMLLQAGGGRHEGEVYVTERALQHAGHETALDMLNRPGGFFPFRPKGGGARIWLVAKARTVTLTVPRTEPEDADRLSAAKQASLEVTLADGSTLTGRATLELPVHHSRILDYLNEAEQFFAITTTEQLLIVNRAHVLHVRPED